MSFTGTLRLCEPSFAYILAALTFAQTNVLVDADGRIRIAGFGTASIPSTIPGADVDRVSHGAAPESTDLHCFGFVGTESTKADDIYAFGVVAWEVSRTHDDCSGRNPRHD